jgi:hypothetical protein
VSLIEVDQLLLGELPARRSHPGQLLEDEPGWRSALGDVSRVSDWAALFSAELDAGPWQAVLQQWLPVLLPGYGGALTHGLIRVADGVRALPAEGPPPPVQLDELAKGLALWAGTFTALPGRPELRGPLTLPQAIARLPRPTPAWSMFEAGSFVRLGELDVFPAAVEALGLPGNVHHALSDLTAASCRMTLDHPDAFAQALVHTVTPAAAIRTLLPVPARDPDRGHLRPALAGERGDRLRVHDRRGTRGTAAADEADPPPLSEILARATEHRDTHVLKFAEAIAREHALRPDPAYLLAANHVIEQLPPW